MSWRKISAPLASIALGCLIVLILISIDSEGPEELGSAGVASEVIDATPREPALESGRRTRANGGSDKEPTVRGQPGATLTVVVRNADGGAPVEGAVVSAWSSSDGSALAARFVARTASNGQCSIDLSEGDVPTQVGIVARGFKPSEIFVIPAGELADGRALLEAQLDTGAGVHGRVVDSRGAPISGARVVCRLRGRTFEWPTHDEFVSTRDSPVGNWALSEVDGSFEVAGLDREFEYTLEATKEGFVARDRLRSGVSAVPGVPVEYVLYKTSLLLVRVVDADTGAPVPAAGGAFSQPSGLAHVDTGTFLSSRNDSPKLKPTFRTSRGPDFRILDGARASPQLTRRRPCPFRGAGAVSSAVT